MINQRLVAEAVSLLDERAISTCSPVILPWPRAVGSIPTNQVRLDEFGDLGAALDVATRLRE